MKTIDERETQKQTKNKKKRNKDSKKQGGRKAIVKEWELDDIIVHLS